MVAKTVVVISSSGNRVVERPLRVVTSIVVMAKVGTVASCVEGHRAGSEKRQEAESQPGELSILRRQVPRRSSNQSSSGSSS